MFNKVNENNNGYSMIGLVITAAIIPVLAIGGFMGYGYYTDDNNSVSTYKTVDDTRVEVDKAEQAQEDNSIIVFNELENNWY